MFIYIFVTLAILGIGVFFLSKFLRNAQPETAEVAEDINLIRDSLSAYRGGFAAWSREQLSVLGYQNLANNETRAYGATEGGGILMNSLNEPVLAYKYKKYTAPGVNALMVACNSEHEFAFRLTNKGIEVSMDGSPFAKLKNKVELTSIDGQLLGKLLPATDGIAAIEVNGQNLGKLPPLPKQQEPATLALPAADFDLSLPALGVADSRAFQVLSIWQLAGGFVR